MCPGQVVIAPSVFRRSVEIITLNIVSCNRSIECNLYCQIMSQNGDFSIIEILTVTVDQPIKKWRCACLTGTRPQRVSEMRLVTCQHGDWPTGAALQCVTAQLAGTADICPHSVARPRVQSGGHGEAAEVAGYTCLVAHAEPLSCQGPAWELCLGCFEGGPGHSHKAREQKEVGRAPLSAVGMGVEASAAQPAVGPTAPSL